MGVSEHEVAAMRKKLDVDVVDGPAIRVTADALLQEIFRFSGSVTVSFSVLSWVQ